MAGSRIYVQEGIYDLLLEGLTKAAEALAGATGGPFEQGVQHGPQVSSLQFEVRLKRNTRSNVDLRGP